MLVVEVGGVDIDNPVLFGRDQAGSFYFQGQIDGFYMTVDDELYWNPGNQQYFEASDVNTLFNL